MDWTVRRKRFRALMSAGRCLHPASVFDPISARITEDIGFEIGMFAGSIGSMTVLDAPDIILMTLTEFAQQAYRINRAGNLPLLVDADHGYGNALNVTRTVEELESAGVAIEDTDLPQPFGTVGSTRLIPVGEGVGKMRAALAGRQDPNLVIAGRTSAVSATSLDDAVARAKAYEKAGVDAMFFTGVKTRVQIKTLSAALNIPIFLGGGGGEVGDLDFLSAKGVRICLQGHQPFMAVIQATHDTLKALRDGADPADLQGVAPAELMKRLTRDERYRSDKMEFLGEK